MRKFSFKRLAKLLPVLALVVILLTTAALATETKFDTENFKGLVLTTTASDVSVTLYNGRTDSAAKMTPVYTEGTTYYYEVTAGNTYYYVAKPVSGSSRYNIRKNVYISAEEANTKTVLDVTPAKRTTSGWDTWRQIIGYSDEAMAAAYPSSPELWPEYDWVFTTPVFANKDRTPHKQTTQTEMMDYMGDLDSEDDNMYVYTLGKSGGSKASEIFDIPVVFFSTTDLSDAATWEEAAALVKDNGKLTVMYQALIHGLEPAGGEAALAMLKALDGAYGADLLENMNICVIPRLNPYGVYMTYREVYTSGGRIDPNRDFLKLESNEVQLRTKLYNAIAPEVCLDSHECNLHPEYDRISLRDVWISTNFTPKATAAYRDMALTIAYKAFDRAKENNLSYGWYASSINGYSGNISSTNVSMRGSLVFLNESMGIAGGMQQMERRVMSHVTYVTAVLDYVNDNTAAVQKVVDDQRADIVNRGKTYEESDIIVLETGSTEHPEHYINGKQVDTGSGEITDTVLQGKIYDVVKQSRVAPTAYVIPAGESWTADVLAKLDIHGIAYTKLPAGAAVQLQQYTGTVSKTELTAEKKVTFTNGAYVMTMAQENAYILALLMEPDVPDLADKTGTFAQQGLITATDGTFPIYRYIRDLNAEGEIDYTTSTFDKENFKGLVLTTTASDVSVSLYNGRTDSAAKMTPVYTEGTTYYYEVTAGKTYHYIAKPVSGYSRYHIRKNVYITEEEAQQKTVLDVTPHTRSTNGWDTSNQITAYSDEVMASAFPSSPDLWPAYDWAFTTPVFTIARNPHKQTTQTEMMNYISGLDDDKDNMYVFNLGKSGGSKASEQFDIPVVFFTTTDLSGATTWEEAAQLLKANGKLTALYQALIHGLEPASGEAALAMLKAFDGQYGKDLLGNMNICVIPRLNPYGVYKTYRGVYVNGSSMDANRDFLKLESNEAQLRTWLYNAIEPELCFDGHEYYLHPTNTTTVMNDLMLSTNFNPKSTAAYRDMAITLAYEAYDRCAENNLTYGWYSGSVNGYNGNIGTGNVMMRGSLVILMETQGITGGMQQMERRMMAHISAVTGVLDYVNENTDAVQKIVDDQRADVVNRGKTYEESDVVILESGTTQHAEYNILGKKVNTGSGEITDNTVEAKIYDVVKKSRTAPTAYVIPAGQDWNAAVLAKLDNHGIAYTKVPAGTAINLQQYTGTVTEASLTAETVVTFPDGAYVMTMAQKNAYILALLMEPDVIDVSPHTGTFAQQGLIEATDGLFPIYRYIRDLNTQGTVDFAAVGTAPEGLTSVGATKIGGTGKITGLDATKTYEYRSEKVGGYTAVPAGATEITDLPVGKYYVRFAAAAGKDASADAVISVEYGVLEEYIVYLDSANGAAGNDGYTETTAVNTMELAYSRLTELMKTAPAGTTGKMVIIGTYTLEGERILPEHNYPLLITGGKFIFKETDPAGDYRYLGMGGDTTFDNITISVGSATNSYYLYGMGHKFTIGENVVCEPFTSSTGSIHFFNLSGGKKGGGTVASTDLTVKSGRFTSVYAADYTGKVTGQAKAVLSNCQIYRLAPSYIGKTQGDLYMELRNVTVGMEIFCGHRNKNDVSGNVTLVLGEGVTAPEGATLSVYAGSSTAGNVLGKVTVVADGIDLTKTPIYGKAANATGTIGGLKLILNKGELADVADTFVTRDGVEIVLGCDQTKAATLNYSCDLDLAGHDATVTVAAGKTLTVCDTTDGELGVLAATGTTAPAEGYQEIAVTGGKSYPKTVTAVPGDMDGDSDKDTDDAVYLLLNAMFGEEDYPIVAAQNRDVNKDGKLDTDDAVYLLLHVMFGAEDYPI